MKKGKEVSIEVKDNYSVYSGTINNKKAKTIYLNISSWGKPIQETELNYDRVIKNLRKSVLSHIYSVSNESNFKGNNTIVDLDMRSSGVNFKKKSFMSCEITLFQKNYDPINSDKSIDTIKKLSTSIIDNVLETNQFFKFTKTK